MNHFKRTAYLSFAILFGVVFSCAAQNKEDSSTVSRNDSNSKKYKYKKRTIEEKARYFTKKMTDSLKVNEAQDDSLYKMNIVLTQKFDSLRTIANTLSRKEKSAAYRSIYAYRDRCMRTILPRREFLKFLDIEREKWERKKAFQRKENLREDK